MKNRKIVERIIPISKSGDSFDLQFWQKAGAQMRFKAAWDMVKEAYKLNGKNVSKFRLQIHIQNIQQI